jgi:hypothetical protein
LKNQTKKLIQMSLIDILTIVSIAFAIFAFLPKIERKYLLLKLNIIDKFIILVCFILSIYLIRFEFFFEQKIYIDNLVFDGGPLATDWVFVIFLFMFSYVFIIYNSKRISVLTEKKINAFFKEKIREQDYPSLIYLVDKFFFPVINKYLVLNEKKHILYKKKWDLVVNNTYSTVDSEEKKITEEEIEIIKIKIEKGKDKILKKERKLNIRLAEYLISFLITDYNFVSYCLSLNFGYLTKCNQLLVRYPNGQYIVFVELLVELIIENRNNELRQELDSLVQEMEFNILSQSKFLLLRQIFLFQIDSISVLEKKGELFFPSRLFKYAEVQISFDNRLLNKEKNYSEFAKSRICLSIDLYNQYLKNEMSMGIEVFELSFHTFQRYIMLLLKSIPREYYKDFCDKMVSLFYNKIIDILGSWVPYLKTERLKGEVSHLTRVLNNMIYYILEEAPLVFETKYMLLDKYVESIFRAELEPYVIVEIFRFGGVIQNEKLEFPEEIKQGYKLSIISYLVQYKPEDTMLIKSKQRTLEILRSNFLF